MCCFDRASEEAFTFTLASVMPPRPNAMTLRGREGRMFALELIRRHESRWTGGTADRGEIFSIFHSLAWTGDIYTTSTLFMILTFNLQI